jgi:hypothetical protein
MVTAVISAIVIIGRAIIIRTAIAGLVIISAVIGAVASVIIPITPVVIIPPVISIGRTVIISAVAIADTDTAAAAMAVSGFCRCADYKSADCGTCNQKKSDHFRSPSPKN